MAFKRSAVRSRSAPLLKVVNFGSLFLFKGDPMKYFVYALYSPHLNKIYIGQRKDLETRVMHHNKGYSKYTSKTNDWAVVYSEEHESRGQALKREKQLKSAKGRAFVWERVAAFKRSAASQ
jgi:putative endonuclease